MKITVITATPVKGVTYFMKEKFLEDLRENNEIAEFYPKDMPPFCLGCKNCFLKSEEKCPHYDKVGPVWESMKKADLLVFAYPVYALRVPASLKSLLDHYCVHWMVHRPDPSFWGKTAVIITNSVGAPNGAAQKDVKTSMSWMGVSKIYTFGVGLMGDILFDKMTPEHKKMLEKKMKSLAHKAAQVKPINHKSLIVSAKFQICRMLHAAVLKTEEVPSADNRYYIDNGWIKDKKKA